MSAFVAALGGSIFISILSFSGGILLVWKRFSTREFSPYLVSFAAGVMLATAFLDIFPESLENASGNQDVFGPALLGILLFFFFERFLLWFHHHDQPHEVKPAATLIILGDALHNFIDGVVIATAFIASVPLGVVTTLAVAAHEIPQEIADFSALVSLGMKKKRALLFNFVSALAAILGTILAFAFEEVIFGQLWLFLAFTGGMFTYIAASDLIPELHSDFKERKNWIQILPFVVGIILIWFSTSKLGS